MRHMENSLHKSKTRQERGPQEPLEKPIPSQKEIVGRAPEVMNQALTQFASDEMAALDSPAIAAKEKKSLRIENMKKAFCGITAGIMMLSTIGCGNNEKKQEKTPEGKKIEDLLKKQDEYAKNFLKGIKENYAQNMDRQQRLRARQAMQDSLNELALGMEKGALGDESVHGAVSKESVQKALEAIDRNVAAFADEEFGNGDGNTDPEEFEKFRTDPAMKDFQLTVMKQLR